MQTAAGETMTVVPLRSVRTQASDWVARLRAENATDADRVAFEAWADQDPAHREAFNRLTATWRRLELLKGAGDIAAESRSGSFNKRYAAIAAGVFLVVGVAVGVVLRSAPAAVATAIGEQRRIVLPDTSAVELNTNSRLAVEFDSRQRKVVLERGEARFKVTAEPNRPFTVIAGNRVIRVVGTEFDVRLKGATAEVLVIQGAVNLTSSVSPGSSVMLRAGELASAGAATPAAPVQPEVMEQKLAWHDGMVSFRGETLGEVLSELNRYNSVQLTASDEKAASLRISGYFRATDVPTFLSRLQAAFPVRVERTAERVAIHSR